ncbi:Mobile element protein [Candidatus Enterovibrio escicola]|uniref:Mobile element protein n=1 Tax=Candidatus Enterovibrio escicola TaxID=1927127 RepID=A0A2A5T4R3_9GAMM|nr:Mobile element protein [Candidatus Enterovibrio escacola]
MWIRELIQSTLLLFCSDLINRKTKPAGIVFVNSTKLQVCHTLCIPRYGVFKVVSK